MFRAKLRDPPALHALDEPSAPCREIRGSREYVGPVDAPGIDSVLQGGLCLHASDGASTIPPEVRAMIGRADVSTEGL